MGKFDACSNLSLDPSCRNNRLFGPLPPVPFPYTLRGAGGLVARAFIVGRGVAQHGSAPRSGRGGPRFKSGRPDHFLFHTRCCFVLGVLHWHQGERVFLLSSDRRGGAGCWLASLRLLQ